MEQRYNTINPGDIIPMPTNLPKNHLSLFASFRGYFQHMCVHVDNINDTCAELARRGGDIIGKSFLVEPNSFGIAFFRDPWGNMIELAETVPGTSA